MLSQMLGVLMSFYVSLLRLLMMSMIVVKEMLVLKFLLKVVPFKREAILPHLFNLFLWRFLFFSHKFMKGVDAIFKQALLLTYDN